MTTLLELIHKNFTGNNLTILNELVKYGFLADSEIPKIIQHDSFLKFFKRKKQSSERVGTINNQKCLARIWANGESRNVQCSFAKHDHSCDFCKRHDNKVKLFGSWYLGKITDPCPDVPIHPGNGLNPSDPQYIPPHETKWICDENGIKIVTKKKTSEKVKDEEGKKEKENGKKKKRGRPPGSKNKKKVKEEEQNVKEEKLTIHGITYTIIDGEIWDTENTGKNVGTFHQGEIIWKK